MANIYSALGAGLTAGSNMGLRLYQIGLDEDRRDVAAKNKQDAQDAYNSEMKDLQEEALRIVNPNPMRNAYSNIMGVDPSAAKENIELDNEEQMAGAAKMTYKIIKDKAASTVDPSTQIAGGAIPSAAPQQIAQTAPPAPAPAQIPVGPTAAPQDTTEVDVDLQVKFGNALIAQESGGNYSAIGPPTRHGKALGKYQIIPKFWFKKIGLNPNSQSDKDKFLKSEKLQDELFTIINDDAWKKAGGDPFKAALVYYSGSTKPSNIDKVPQPGMPTPRQYAQSIVDKMGTVPVQAQTGYGALVGQQQAGGQVQRMLEKEVLKGPPSKEDIKNQYLSHLTSIMQSPKYIKASPAVQKDFRENFIKPYRELGKVDVGIEKTEIEDFNAKMNGWSRNARAVMQADIQSAKDQGKTKGRSQINQALGKVQSQIRRIDSFRRDYSKASNKRKKELLAAFSEYAQKEDNTGFWASVGFNLDQVTTLEQTGIDRVVKELHSMERDLINQLVGSGSSTIFQGLPEDIPSAEEETTGNKQLDKWITWDEE